MTDLRIFAKIFYFCAHRIIILSRASPVLIFPMSVQSNESKVFSKHISNFFTNFESFPRQVTHNIWNWILKLFTVKIPFFIRKKYIEKNTSTEMGLDFPLLFLTGQTTSEEKRWSKRCKKSRNKCWVNMNPNFTCSIGIQFNFIFLSFHALT